jgi:hypothetical protein
MWIYLMKFLELLTSTTSDSMKHDASTNVSDVLASNRTYDMLGSGSETESVSN